MKKCSFFTKSHVLRQLYQFILSHDAIPKILLCKNYGHSFLLWFGISKINLANASLATFTDPGISLSRKEEASGRMIIAT